MTYRSTQPDSPKTARGERECRTPFRSYTRPGTMEMPPSRNRQSVYPRPQMSAPNWLRCAGREDARFLLESRQGYIQKRGVCLPGFIQTVESLVGGKHCNELHQRSCMVH